MNLLNFAPLLLAADEAAPPPPNGMVAMMILLAPLFVLYYFIMIRPQRKDQVRREQMLKALKKNDSVVTIGGIKGTVANVSQDGKEVTLKVDDNTRIKMLTSAIQSVQNAKEEAASP